MTFLKIIDSVVGLVAALSLPRPPLATNQVGGEKILVIRPGGIGDAVLLIPALVALKEAYPHLLVHALAENRNCEVFAMTPVVDQVLLYHNPSHLFSVFRARYDVVIDTEQWHRLSAVVARLCRPRMSVGFSTNERKKLFTHQISYSHTDHESSSFFKLLKPLGIPLPEDVFIPFLNIPEAASAHARALLGTLTDSPYVAIFTGATVPEKQWGRDHFRELVCVLKDHSVPVVLIGGNDEEQSAAEIVSGCSGISVAGRTSLAVTAAIIANARVLVTGDSGVLHLAYGLGTPTVSLFGPSNMKKWAPPDKRHIAHHHDVPCAPCASYGYTPHCTAGIPCIREIPVDDVVASVFSLFGSP